jgi:hypothetical protein
MGALRVCTHEPRLPHQHLLAPGVVHRQVAAGVAGAQVCSLVESLHHCGPAPQQEAVARITLAEEGGVGGGSAYGQARAAMWVVGAKLLMSHRVWVSGCLGGWVAYHSQNKCTLDSCSQMALWCYSNKGVAAMWCYSNKGVAALYQERRGMPSSIMYEVPQQPAYYYYYMVYSAILRCCCCCCCCMQDAADKVQCEQHVEQALSSHCLCTTAR